MQYDSDFLIPRCERVAEVDHGAAKTHVPGTQKEPPTISGGYPLALWQNRAAPHPKWSRDSPGSPMRTSSPLNLGTLGGFTCLQALPVYTYLGVSSKVESTLLW